MRTLLLSLLMVFAICKVQAEDEVLAGFHCPDNVWLDCNDELWDLSIYGNAYYVDYSGNHHYAGAPHVTHNLNSCNAGTIVRTWTYEDQYWHTHTCSQTIYVNGGTNFNSYGIHWPQDIVLEGCHANYDPYDLPTGHDHPSYTYQECSQIGVSHKDDVFYFGGDCKKIRRTWTLIDWCTYNPNGYSNQGIWTWVQLIKITNDYAPNLYCPMDVKVASFDCDSAVVLLPPVSADHSACGGYFTVTNNSHYAYANGADASGTYPIGVHNIHFSFAYGCGVHTSCYVKIIVEDGKGPVPYCYGQLAVALMPIDSDWDGVPEDGMVTIWAKDLDKGSYLPCGGYGGYNNNGLHFSFSPDITDTNKTFTCADIGKNDVRMYVTDHYGRQSYCIVEVDVQNNSANIPNCYPAGGGGGGYANYSGQVNGRMAMTYNAPLPNTEMQFVAKTGEIQVESELQSVEEVQVIVDSYQTPLGNTIFRFENDRIEHYTYDTTYVAFTQSVMTNEDGAYISTGLMTNEVIEMKPVKNTCDLSKVTIEDAKVLHAFITGTSTFDDPLLYLAADVDENMKVDFDDLIHLIKFVTGERSDLPCETPYWFIEENRTSTDPFDLPIINPIELTLATNQQMTYNMLAIMKGDLDVMVEPNQLQDILDNSTLEINATTGVDDLSIVDVNVQLSPNPASEFVKIQMSGKGLESSYNVNVYNTAGELVTTQKVSINGNQMNIELDINEFSNGYYFYNIVGQSAQHKGSFIKN